MNDISRDFLGIGSDGKILKKGIWFFNSYNYSYRYRCVMKIYWNVLVEKGNLKSLVYILSLFGN